jgi:hypothetical protein
LEPATGYEGLLRPQISMCASWLALLTELMAFIRVHVYLFILYFTTFCLSIYLFVLFFFPSPAHLRLGHYLLKHYFDLLAIWVIIQQHVRTKSLSLAVLMAANARLIDIDGSFMQQRIL